MPEVGRRNPDWEWDEIVLACDLVKQNDWRALPAENPQVIELSGLLQRMTLHPVEARRPDFRNPNGVGRKTADIATRHPGYTGRPTHGNALDEKVMARFIAEPDVMHALAQSIRDAVADGEPADFPREVGYDDESELEGRYLLRWHAYRERNPALRRRKINSVMTQSGTLECEVCGFDFARVYGERGRGFIECHHVEPLHVSGEGPRTIRDLALLCSNCHRMIHTRRHGRPLPSCAKSSGTVTTRIGASEVMALRDLTRGQVLAAIAEYDRLGQDEFLHKYRFDQARSYRLIHDGKAYDSKAIVGAAHGFPPGERPLRSSEFSGGEATVGRLLRRLGFVVSVSQEQLTLPYLVSQITTLQVDRSSGPPALYQPITLLWAVGRAHRGDPRIETWAATQLHLGELLLRYGHPGIRARADYPIAALHGAGLWEVPVGATPVPAAHGDAELRRWFDEHQPRSGLIGPAYNLIRSSGEARVMVVGTILDTFFPDKDCVELLEAVGLSGTWIAAEMGDSGDDAWSASPLEDAYRHLCGIAGRNRKFGDGRRVSRTSDRLVRSAAARRAVLMRSGGTCENPHCTGQMNDLTDSGDPILEIDHIHDLALGGPDDPVQMIALCPNCHAIKTRGRTREQLRGLLLVTARKRHEELSR